MIRNLAALGYSENISRFLDEKNLQGFTVGRVISEHKERYVVYCEIGEFEAEVTGRFRFNAQSREDFPATGDWVVLTVHESGVSIIHEIIPRQSTISRKAVGHFGESQIIAVNIDYALIVQAVDRDFNINRLERYLTICYSSKVTPIIVLTKLDLISDHEKMACLNELHERLDGLMILPISNITKTGYDLLKGIFEKGKTYCLLGSSGVGKSTLLNNLSGRAIMNTGSVSGSTGKGRHVTSHRELIVLESGGVLIDNPGMREVGVIDTAQGIEATFKDTVFSPNQCKFSDCTHTVEIGCSVLEALSKGELNADAYENYMKLEKENAYFQQSENERRKKDRAFGKMMKHYKKNWATE